MAATAAATAGTSDAEQQGVLPGRNGRVLVQHGGVSASASSSQQEGQLQLGVCEVVVLLMLLRRCALCCSVLCFAASCCKVVLHMLRRCASRSAPASSLCVQL
jgi:hypothetical protein